MQIVIDIFFTNCLVGLALLAYSRQFRRTAWGPLPPRVTISLMAIRTILANETDRTEDFDETPWRGYAFFSIITIGAILAWPIVLLSQRQEHKHVLAELKRMNAERDAKRILMYTEPLPAEQDAKTVGEVRTRYLGSELPKGIMIEFNQFDQKEGEFLRRNSEVFALREGYYVATYSYGKDNPAAIPVEDVRQLVYAIDTQCLTRKLPLRYEPSFERPEVTVTARVALFDSDTGENWFAKTVELESSDGETTCVHYVGSHKDGGLRKDNRCWLVDGEVGDRVIDFVQRFVGNGRAHSIFSCSLG